MSAGPLPAAAGELVRLRPLTLVDDGDDVLVGDPEGGTFVAVPPVGAVVIRALQRGATTGEAAADAERHAGEPVDVESFVDTLRELGFVDEGPQDAPAAAEELPVPRRTAPVQQRRWLRVPLRQQHARLLFTPAAWCCYAVAFAFCVACFALRPDLWPRAADVFVLGDNPLSVIAAVLLSYLLAAVHETWHWLAARSLGLAARFGVDRRLYFLVFETDLSQLWSVPRRRRYGPQLAGLAVDSVSLAALLRSRSWPAPPGSRCRRPWAGCCPCWSSSRSRACCGSARFWLTVAGSALLYLPLLGVPGIWLAGRRRRPAGRSA